MRRTSQKIQRFGVGQKMEIEPNVKFLSKDQFEDEFLARMQLGACGESIVGVGSGKC